MGRLRGIMERCGAGEAAGVGALWDSLARAPATSPAPSLLVVGPLGEERQQPPPGPSLVVIGSGRYWLFVAGCCGEIEDWGKAFVPSAKRVVI